MADFPSDATLPVADQAGTHCMRALIAVVRRDRDMAPSAVAGGEAELRLHESIPDALTEALELNRRYALAVAIHHGPCLATADGVRPLDATAMVARALAEAAAPDRLLLSERSFEALAGELPADAPWVSTLSWRALGRYRIEGEPEDLGVVEVSAKGRVSDVPPEHSGALVRLPDEGLIPGWRAAVGQEVPLRPGWRLERKLGAGGFGEAWLGRREGDGEARVFKFCYHASRLTSLKREVTLFRLLQKGLAGCEGIVPLLDWHLDSPPYFLESAYVAGGDLRRWAVSRGGLASLPLAQRLGLAAQMGEALAAAHAVGVLHKDIKPSNVLIEDGSDGPRVRLADFGVGAITDELRAEASEMTVVGGGSRSALFAGTALIGGTPMYMAPELFEGRPPSIHGDAFALGVVLYQLAVGDFGRALGADWQDDIASPVLREDIAALTARDPALRRTDLRALAAGLRRVEEREAALHAAERAAARAARGRRLRRLLVPALAAVTLLALVLAGMLQRISEEAARANAEAERANREAASAREVTDFFVGLFRIANPDESRGAQVTVREVLDRGAERVDAELAGQPLVRARLLNVIGNVYRQLGLFRDAAPMLERGIDIERAFGVEPLVLAGGMNRLAAVYADSGDYARAVPLLEESLALMEASGLDTDPHYGDALSILGSVLNDMGARERAGPVLERTLAWRRQHLAAESLPIAVSLNNLGFHRLQSGDYRGAAELFEQALEIRRRALGEEHSETAITWNNVAAVRRIRGDLEEAEEGARRATAIWEATLGDQHAHTTVGWHNLGALARMRGDLEESRRHFERSLAVRRASFEGDHPWLASATGELASTLSALGEHAQAEALARESLALRISRHGEDHHETGLARLRLADILLAAGRFDAAADEASTALDRMRQSQAAAPEDRGLRQDLAQALLLSGRVAVRSRDREEAVAHWQQALALLEGIEGEDRLARVDQLRARLYAAVGHRENALQWRRRMEAGGQRDPLLDALSAEADSAR
jgi:tetratricopeptide (TPR) repeat protein